MKKKNGRTVYGPPGTGKSTYLIERIRAVIELNVDRVAVLSFTKAAANELVARAGVDLDVTKHNISTIHSLCYKVNELIPDRVVDKNDLKDFSKLTGIPFGNGSGMDDDYESKQIGDIYSAVYDLARNRLEDPAQTYVSTVREGTLPAFLFFVEMYEKWKQQRGLMDFTDMLQSAIHKGTPPYSVYFVDEAQDLSKLQWLVLDHWMTTARAMTVAGDDDQAIYVWSGAHANGMAEFSERYSTEQVILSQSYRIPETVRSLSNKVINGVAQRVSKEYSARDEQGSVERINMQDICKSINTEGSTMILYRCHAMRPDIEEELMSKHVPYTVVGGLTGPLDGFMARAIQLFSSIQSTVQSKGTPVLSARQEVSLKRNLTPSAWYLWQSGKYDQLVSKHWSEVIDGRNVLIKNYLLKMEDKYGDISKISPSVKLSTIHGSKGGEADTVILYNTISPKIEEDMFRSGQDAELRTFYVGITRAKHHLKLIDGSCPLKWWTERPRW